MNITKEKGTKKMSYTSINETNNFGYEFSQIRSASIDSHMQWQIRRLICLENNSQNASADDIYIPHASITMKDFSVKSVTISDRKVLTSDRKGSKIVKGRALYKSELDAFVRSICEDCTDLYNMTSTLSKDGYLITAELSTDDNFYTAEFLCSEFVVSWDIFGDPLPKRRLTLKERAAKLQTDIPAMFLALGHPDTPQTAKIICAVAVAYGLSPIDLIPDFIPVIGYLDDIIILTGLIYMAVRLIPDEVWAECREKSKEMWQNGKPTKWYYALPTVIFWLLIIMIIIAIIT